MNSTGEGHHVDFLRAFFRLRVDDLGRLLPYVMDITRKSIHEAPAEAWKALWEANSVVLVRFCLVGSVSTLMPKSVDVEFSL